MTPRVLLGLVLVSPSGLLTLPAWTHRFTRALEFRWRVESSEVLVSQSPSVCIFCGAIAAYWHMGLGICKWCIERSKGGRTL